MKKLVCLNICCVRIVLLSLAFCLFNLQSSAQSKSNKGTEFWVGFMFHYEGSSAGHSLYITSDSNTSGTVSVPGESWSQNFTVTANNLTVVTVPSSVAYNGCSDCITTKGVKIVSDDNVVVYAHQYLGNQSDATLVLPTRTLGKDYFAASYYQSSASSTRGRSTFLIVATQDDTKVRIIPKIAIQKGSATASTGSLPANDTINVTLDEGEIYQGYGASAGFNDDVTGTSFEVIDTGATANCRKIAVFTGSSYARVGSCTGGSVNSGDNLFEQMYPTNSWGKRFVLVPALGRAGDDFRFIAQEDGTEVVVFKVGGAPDIFNLNKGDFAQISDESAIRSCQSNKPIMVSQYQRTARCDGGGNRVGDPSMTILNPLEQTLTDITVYSSSFYDIDNHYINVVMPGFATGSFRIDGVGKTFTTVPNNSYYSYARIPVSSGNHRLTASAGFIATAYGEGNWESYGYAAGANVIDLTAVASVSNSTQVNAVANCIGRPTNFAGTAEYAVVRWEWDFGDGTIDSVQNPTHLYTDTGTYKVRLYTYKPSFDGCSSFDSSFLDVSIYGKPEARITKANLCDSLTAALTDRSVIPDGETHLTSIWDIQGASALKYTSGGVNSVSHIFDTTGKFRVSMEVITANQCKDTFVDSLVVNPIPQADFIVSDVCFSDSSFILNTSTVASGTVDSFSWEFSDGSFSRDENPRIFFQDSGQQFAALEVTSDSGCTNLVQKYFYKYPRFELGFTFNDTCFGNGQTFVNTTILEGGSFTDTFWYTSDPLRFDSTYNYTDTFSNATYYDVSLVMEQDSFCRDTLTQRVNVHPLPIVDFLFNETCLGDSTEFTDLSSLSTGSYTTSWDFGGGNMSTLQDPKYLFTSGGIKNVSLTIITDEGCEMDTTQEVLITFPSITAINVTDICEGDSLILTADTVRGLDSFSTYTWSYDGLTSSTPEVRTTYSTLGKTIVSLDVLTKNGCLIQEIDSFITNAKPKPNFLVSGVCEGLDLSPTENSTIDASAVISQYMWYSDGVFVSSDQNPTLSSGTAGNRSLKLVTEADNGCVDSIQKLAVVYPIPTSSYTSTDMCVGANNTLTSASSVASGTVTGVFWTIDGVSFTGNTINPNLDPDGEYAVMLITESDRGCRDTLENTVDVHPLPILSFSIEDTSGCAPLDINVKSTSTINTGSISNYTYKWGDGMANSSDSSHTFTSNGDYTIEVVGESDQGCKDSVILSSMITVFDNPIADFSFTPNKPSTLTQFVLLKDSSTGNIVEWEWETSDGGYYTDEVSRHTFSDSGSYAVTLTVVDDNGCEHDTTKFIYVNADLFVYIPNSFTPNGDGLNDDFGLAGVIAGVSKMEMEIYNRWGEKVFGSTNVNDRWDGTYKGELVPTGVYVYKVRFTNPKQTKWFFLDGEIHLIRQ